MKKNEELIFQISDWDYFHEDDGSDDASVQKFIIKLFGTTKEGTKVYAKVNGFTPYFYVEIPKEWRNSKVSMFIEELKRRVHPDEKNSLKTWEMADRHKFYGFTNYKFFNFVRLVFHNYTGFRAYSRVLNKKIYNRLLGPKAVKYEQYESNLEPMLRCMHIRNVRACGWVSIPAEKYKVFEGKSSTSFNDIEVSFNWTNLNPYDDENISKFIVASFDLECTSEDGVSFPQPENDGDKIIQIGTTFNYYGDPECFYKHIITLGSCDPIDNVDIESYETEEEVLMAWTKLIRKMNPDVVTGYNIFGFDYSYLNARAKKLGITKKFTQLGRLKGLPSEYVTKDLSSSALGKNILYYYKMDGRVQVDLMKVVMRDYRLSSYKLDNVASEFIKEQINPGTKVVGKNKTLIQTKNTFGLTTERVIRVYYNDGLSDTLYKEGKKFKVLELTKNSILIDGELDEEALSFDKYKVYWCQAKDDVDAKDIFKLQLGSSADRAIIAKYCIQDCMLVNKLMEKLQILTNNIGMSNVCHVPLAYIFLRGQGIKIFSLVAKKCRERNHLIPVLKKKYVPREGDKNIIPKKYKADEDTDEPEDPEGYEGATVLKPKKGVHYAPIPVLDYSSLYPSSMIHRNLSHECLVEDKEYDNLEGYIYYDVTFYNNDGTSITSKYAKKTDGTMGIIPEILQELLTARKNTRAKIELEPDPFKQKILEGLQLAFKLTANSLYGQTGAPTSAIYKREIAASTTGTGREMLNCARLFAEYVFKTILKAVIAKDYDLYVKRMKLLFDKKIDELLGKDVINMLKESHYKDNDDPTDTSHLSKPADYYYLRVFQERFKPITDSDFVNTKLGLKNMDDYLRYFYDDAGKALEGLDINPKCAYGDSVTPDTPLFLRKNGKIEIRTIDDLGNEWKKYNRFKPGDNTLTNKEQNSEPVDYEVWTDSGWAKVKRVIRHKCKKKIFRILTHTGAVDVTEDHSLLDKDGNIIKPTDCVVGTELLHKELPIFNPINDDSLVFNEKYGELVFNEKLSAMNYFCKLKSLGYNVSIDIDNNYHKLIYSLEPHTQENSTAIKKIIDMGYTDDYVYDLETASGHFNAGVGEMTVKNTDSIFIDFDIIDIITKIKLTDHKGLKTGMKLGQLCGNLINRVLPPPQNLTYEKTFWPWIILTKKRYVGNKYEFDPDKYSQSSMGIVLKRRDNAPIVKIIVGGIIKCILNERSNEKAIEFAKTCLKDILSGKYPLDKFVITKTLKGPSMTVEEQKVEEARPREDRFYADRKTMVHAVLADRMAERDPGNRPQSNDRIPYVYKIVKGKPKLQGDRVETPEYLIESKQKIDYLFYITNQIMKPAVQFLENVTDDATKIFDDYIMREQNKRKGLRPISSYFNNIVEDSDENCSDSDQGPGDQPIKFLLDDSPEEEPTKLIIQKKKKAPVKKKVVIKDEPENNNFSLDL